MCSGSEAGSYSRLIDFVYHSTLGLRVIKKKKTTWARTGDRAERAGDQSTRVVKIDVYYTIRPFKRTPGTKVDCNSLEVWKCFGQIHVKSSETSSTRPGRGRARGGRGQAGARPRLGFRV